MKVRSIVLQSALIAVALVVGAAMPLVAQAPATGIVLVDGERATGETAIGQRVRDRVNAAAEQWQQRLSGLQAELTQLGQQRQQQQLTLSQQALAELTAQIEEKQVELQRLQDDAQRAMARIQGESVEEVNNALIPVLEAMAAERGYQMVFDTRMTQTGGLLYFANALDITDEFIERVNAANAPQ